MTLTLWKVFHLELVVLMRYEARHQGLLKEAWERTSPGGQCVFTALVNGLGGFSLAGFDSLLSVKFTCCRDVEM